MYSFQYIYTQKSMATIYDLPYEIHCHILSNIDRPYWALFGQTCSALQSIIVSLKDRQYHDVANVWKVFIRDDNIKLIKYLFNHKYKVNNNVSKYAARYGNLDIYKFIIGRLCIKISNELCNVAAKYGHLELLKWSSQHISQFRLNTWICFNAAENGHLEILKWARENGCEWNCYTCAYAALNGHLEVLKWVRE